MFGQFFNTFILNLQDSSNVLTVLLKLVGRICRDTSNTLAKSTTSVLLDLRPSPFGTHKLIFRVNRRTPKGLAPASFDLHLVKGDVPQYHRGLIFPAENNPALAE